MSRSPAAPIRAARRSTTSASARAARRASARTSCGSASRSRSSASRRAVRSTRPAPTKRAGRRIAASISRWPTRPGLRPQTSGLSGTSGVRSARRQPPHGEVDELGMSRDPWQLKVFVLADALVVEVYRVTSGFPAEERYGLQSQIRRAAVSAAANLVEGCARPTKADSMRFVAVAIASASEARYLLGLAARLDLASQERTDDLVRRYGDVIRGLQALHAALRGLKSDARPRSEA